MYWWKICAYILLYIQSEILLWSRKYSRWKWKKARKRLITLRRTKLKKLMIFQRWTALLKVLWNSRHPLSPQWVRISRKKINTFEITWSKNFKIHWSRTTLHWGFWLEFSIGSKVVFTRSFHIWIFLLPIS